MSTEFEPNLISAGIGQAAALNENLTGIQTALENSLSRTGDGTGGNAMESALDMNGHRILNLPAAGSDAEPVRRGDLVTGDNADLALVDADLQQFKSDLASPGSGNGADLVANTVQVYNLHTDFADDFQAAFTAVQASSPQYSILVIPEGDYTISSKCTMTLASESKRVTIMAVGKVNITSTVVGDRTWEIIDAQFLEIVGRPHFIGNGLTGVSGNGHAIALVDSNPGPGTYYPAGCKIDAFCSGFRGNDVSELGQAMYACGVYMGNGLNVIIDGFYTGNAIGTYMEGSANSGIKGVYSLNDYYAHVFDNCADGCFVAEGADILSSGWTAPYYQVIGSYNVPYGGVFAKNCDCPITVYKGKFKNNISQIIGYNSKMIEVHNCHIRPRDTNENGNAGIWVVLGGVLTVQGGDFMCVTSPSANYQCINFDAGNNTGRKMVNIHGVHLDPSNTVEYFASIDGNDSANPIGLNATGNIFGSANRPNTLTITDIFKLTNGIFYGQIKGNLAIAGDNSGAGHTIGKTVNKSTNYSASSTLDISNNYDQEYLNGTITTKFSSFVPTYSVTNVSTDRSYDANSTTADELADVLGTLIADLRQKNIVA